MEVYKTPYPWDQFQTILPISEEEPEIGILDAASLIVEDVSLALASTITISWEGYSLEVNPENEEQATLNRSAINGTIDNNQIVLTFEVTEPGTYAYKIPAKYVIATDEDGNFGLTDFGKHLYGYF